MKKSTCYLIACMALLLSVGVLVVISMDPTPIIPAAVAIAGIYCAESTFEIWNEKDDGPK